MKSKKIYSSMSLVLIVSFCLTTRSSAQQKESMMTIDDSAILAKLEKETPILALNKEWNIVNLRNNIKNLKATDLAKATLPKADHKVLTSEEIYAKRSSGAIMVGRYYDCGNCDKMHTSIASGSILNEDGICITNYHVLSDIIESGPASKSRDSLAFISTIDGRIFPIVNILSYSKAGDAAIFKIDTKGEKLNPIPLGNPAGVGAKIHAITNPNGYYYYYTEGVVARNVKNSIVGSAADRMEITADYAKGSSGGPILDSYGNLVGMVSTTTSIYYNGQENLQMVIKSTIPVKIIKSLLINN